MAKSVREGILPPTIQKSRTAEDQPTTMKDEHTLFGWSEASHAVNLSKGLTGPILLSVLVYKQNYAFAPVMYVALHGLYGYLWILKQVYFPDKNFMARPSHVIEYLTGIKLNVQSQMVEMVLNLLIFIGLCGYWVGGISLILDHDRPDVSSFHLALVVVGYAIGVFLHFGADIQKSERLKHKNGLITDGLFSICRSPGHLGETLIYCSFFALCPMGYSVQFSISLLVFGLPASLIAKERRISRHPEYVDYSKRVKLLIPYVF